MILNRTFKRYYGQDMFNRQTVKVFALNPNRKPPLKEKKTCTPCTKTIQQLRVNSVGIQMLPSDIHKHVFPKNESRKSASNNIIEQCRRVLAKHGMGNQPNQKLAPDIQFKLPPLEGQDLIEHFYNIGKEQALPYQTIIHDLLKGIPPMPSEWLMEPGWTMYEPGKKPVSIPYPSETGLVFDVEVCMQAGKAPTIATAVGRNAWYCWVSPSVLEAASKPLTSHQYSLDTLIPLQTPFNERYLKNNVELSRARVVIGHNVSYDRARVKEQYWLQQTGLRFVDTMSMHISVSGLTSYQRAVLKSGKIDQEDEAWIEQSSLNSLAEVYQLYCNKKLEKETRNLFVKGSLKDINKEFQLVTNYCAKDVKATFNIIEKLFPIFLERFPHPVTFAGMLEIGMAYLPINSNWNRYIDEAEQTYNDMETEMKFILARKADYTCQLLHQDQYKDDLWMWDQDWTVRNLRMRATLPNGKRVRTSSPETNESPDLEETVDDLDKKFAYLTQTRNCLYKIRPLLPGYPEWYRKLCTKPDGDQDWVPGPTSISTSMQITPKLLGLTWEGFPLHYIRENGWGFLVPITNESDTNIPLKQLIARCPLNTHKPTHAQNINRRMDDELIQILGKKEYYERLKDLHGDYKGTGVWCNTILDNCVHFYKLPHKDGVKYKVGNPLAKDFLSKFSESVLAGDTESAEHVLSIARKLSYWRNNRSRILEQMIIWLHELDLPKHLHSTNTRYGAILPQVVVSGTLTRRAVEPTWMTASNAHMERIGSELRAMIQAPPGYCLVGADVDSQELWIASVIGDAHLARTHGASPFGWMTLSGSKATGTDMHSVTAKAIGISREHAKVINYARIYGAGQSFAEQLLRQFNPSMSEEEARKKASRMFALTKGKRIYVLKKEFTSDLEDMAYSKWHASKLSELYKKPIEEMFEAGKWINGTESAMFNRLEEIASNPKPSTPFLNSRLSRALEPGALPGDRFLPTRINWVVQSGAVDFLHLMLVCMKWLMGERIRFCLSFHDEIRYLVPDSERYQAALAMHVTNLLTRSFCSLQLGINDLPKSVAFFSSVEIDSVLRKESKMDCRTPSNPHGLEKGYGVAYGESVTIEEAVEKAGADYAWWQERKSNVKSNKKKTCPNGDTSR